MDADRGPLRAGLSLLGQSGFARLFCARFISAFGSAMAPVAMAFGVLERTDSPSAVGYVVACQSVGQVLTLVFAGALADRWSRKRVIVGADLTAFASQSLMALLLAGWLGDGESTWPLALLMTLNGVAFAFLWPAITSAVPQVVARDDLQPANALLSIAFASAFGLGGAAAGLIVAHFGAAAAIAVDATTFAVSALLVGSISFGAQARDEATSFLRELRDGWSEFTSHRWLWTIVAQFSLVVAGYQGGLFIVGPIASERTLGGPEAYGAVIAAWGLGQVTGGLLAMRLNLRRPMLVATFCVFTFALPLWGFAQLTLVPVIALAAFVAGICGELFAVLWYTELHTRVAPEKLSRVSAYDAFGSMALAPVGEAAAGPLVEAYGTRVTLWLAIALIVVPTILVLGVREVRTLGTEDGPPAPGAQEPSAGTS